VLLDQTLGVFAGLLRTTTADALINTDFLADTPAEQSPAGQPRRLGRDVPERVLDAAEGRVDNRAAREARGVVHQVPQVLDVPRVLANQPELVILDDFDRCFIRAAGISLADAFDSLVGEHLDVDPVSAAVPDHERLDVGDLDRKLVAHRSGRLERRRRQWSRYGGIAEKLSSPHDS